ncbi:MAG: signal transduction histidine kinase/putative methionine-R-sulfoxide reductase with GAF domain [Myxococcota bacterium]|jgi:signal transduction histidine kinase/putative methionine-R-sulfoxide reductase with GAF domain
MSVVEEAEQSQLHQRVECLERELSSQRDRMNAIREIGTALGSTLNLDRLLSLIMGKITDLMDADRSTLFLLDEENGQLWSKVAQGQAAREIRINVGEGIAGWVAKTGQAINIKDAYKDPRFSPEVDRRTGYQTQSMVCQAIRNHRRKIIGVVQVLNKRSGYFTVDDEQLLAALGSQAAVSIENSKLYLNVVGKNIELLDTQEQLKERIAEIDLLFRIEQEMNRATDMERFLDSVLTQTCQAVPSQIGALFIREPTGFRLVARGAAGSAESVRTAIDTSTESIGLQVSRTNNDFLSNDLLADGFSDPIVEDALGITLRSAIAVPLELGEEPLGALLLGNRLGSQPEYRRQELKLLTLMAGRIEAALILSRQRQSELDESRLGAIGQALSGVLHDLKTPMTIIGGYAQLMVDEEEEAERSSYAQTITRQLGAIKSMTSEILSFARGEANLLIRKIFLHQFIIEVEEGVTQEFAGGTKLNIDLEYRDAIRMDVGKVKRVIFNLARNARQAMHGSGEFTIRFALDEAADAVDMTFTDTGPGIPAEIRHNVFESFVTSGKKDGTGLGLAMAKTIVEQHHGSIDFTTEPGVGTTFHIRLPRNPQSMGPA